MGEDRQTTIYKIVSIGFLVKNIIAILFILFLFVA